MEWHQGMRGKIIEQAYARLLASGFKDLSVNSLAEASGVSKRTFYKYFTSVDNFLEALMARIQDRVHEEFSGVLQGAPAAQLEAIQNLFKTLPRAFGRHFEIFMVEMHKCRPDLVRAFLDFRRREFDAVVEMLLASPHANLQKRSLSRRVARDALVTLFEQLATPYYLSESGENMETVVSTITGIFLHGILEPPRKKTRN